MQKKANPIALLPVLVFLVLYLGLGIIFEYVMKIPMGFYSIPIVVVFLIALLVACLQNQTLSFDDKLAVMGQGIGDKNVVTMLLIFLAAGMFETSMVAILVSAICALIREYGGFEALLGWIKRVFHGKRGGQLGMGLLVGAMDIATANNTVAIVIANPIAKEMAEEYGITPRKAASLLDTFSCVFQGIIPYGAQMLVAISAAHELGYEVSAFEIMPKLFYPLLLAVSSLFFIAIDGKKRV